MEFMIIWLSFLHIAWATSTSSSNFQWRMWPSGSLCLKNEEQLPWTWRPPLGSTCPSLDDLLINFAGIEGYIKFRGKFSYSFEHGRWMREGLHHHCIKCTIAINTVSVLCVYMSQCTSTYVHVYCISHRIASAGHGETGSSPRLGPEATWPKNDDAKGRSSLEHSFFSLILASLAGLPFSAFSSICDIFIF